MSSENIGKIVSRSIVAAVLATGMSTACIPTMFQPAYADPEVSDDAAKKLESADITTTWLATIGKAGDEAAKAKVTSILASVGSQISWAKFCEAAADALTDPAYSDVIGASNCDDIAKAVLALYTAAGDTTAKIETWNDAKAAVDGKVKGVKFAADTKPIMYWGLNMSDFGVYYDIDATFSSTSAYETTVSWTIPDEVYSKGYRIVNEESNMLSPEMNLTKNPFGDTEADLAASLYVSSDGKTLSIALGSASAENPVEGSVSFAIHTESVKDTLEANTSNITQSSSPASAAIDELLDSVFSASTEKIDKDKFSKPNSGFRDKYTTANFTVSFDSKGGSKVEDKAISKWTDDDVADFVKSVSDNPPTRTGYTFAGWFADKDLTVPFDPFKIENKDANAYAKWTEQSNSNTNGAAAGSNSASNTKNANTSASSTKDISQTGDILPFVALGVGIGAAVAAGVVFFLKRRR